MKTKTLKTLAAAAAVAAAMTVSAYASSMGGATVEASALNLRSSPNTGAPIYTTAPRGTAVVVGGMTNDGWYKVVYRGTIGYMSSEYLSYSTNMDGSFGYGTINGTSVRMRDGAGLSANIIGTYSNREKMNVIGVYGEWYKVQYNGKTGFVHSDYIALNGGVSEVHTGAVTASPAGDASSPGQAIVDTAMKYMGVPYVWAGTSPSGFDCSGLVYYVYKENGYSINRTAASIYENGSFVEKSQLQPGDAVCFTNSSSSSIGHVGIYIGNGQFIHASSGSGSVIISDLSSTYYLNHYVGARRIV